MKKISANYIFPGNAAPIKNGVVVVDDAGKIMDLIDPAKANVDWNEVIQHEGIICPGFVNTHCHLELSYLKGKVSEDTQLHGFVKELMSIREDFSLADRKEAIANAEKEMLSNGIVAVGDISNGDTSFELKAQNNIAYHTFVEVFGLNPDDAQDILERAKSLVSAHPRNHLASVTPHAPYSLSDELVSLVDNENAKHLTIHNQETESENELFRSGSGALYKQLANFSDAIKTWQPTGKNSLPSYINKYSEDKKIQLVHNTFTAKEDIEFASTYSSNIYWCFCPNANQFIEGRQPEYKQFLKEKCTIGTDSLASNWSLSILDELKAITKNAPAIPLELLIKWATFNGAEFLGFEGLGSIELGKSPGLNLISGVEDMKLSKESAVTPLILH